MSSRPAGGPLVGRAAELGVLQGALRQVRAGGSLCMLLTGPPGIGKTRLTEELVARSGDRVVTLTARGYSLGDRSPFSLWVEALESRLRLTPPAIVRGLFGGLVEDAAGVLPSATLAAGGAPRRQPPRPRVLEALAVLCANLARERPLVVLLDDLHLADGSSLEVLSYLVRNLRRAPILFLATARTGELAATAAGELVLRLEQDGMLRRLEVPPLGPDGLRGLVLAADPELRAPAALVEWLDERSRGVPLFAIGLLRALREEGADWEQPRLTRLPEDLEERVRSLTGALSATAHQVLEVLAVTGQRAMLADLPGLTGLDTDALADALEPLLRFRLVSETVAGRDPGYEISHPLVQEAVYAAIVAPRRRRLHRQVAFALLAGDRLSAAAPHFARSADVGDDTAIDVLRDALGYAWQREASREASAILRDLVEILPARDPRWLDVLEYLRWQADWVIDHKFEVGEESVRTAIAAVRWLGDQSTDQVLRGQVVYCHAVFLGWDTGELVEARAAAGEAGRLLRLAGRPDLARLADDKATWLLGFAGDLRGQESAARQLAAGAEAADDPIALDNAEVCLAYALMLGGRESEAEALLGRVIATAGERGLVHRLATSWAAMAQALAFQGRLEEARAALGRGAADSSAYPDTILMDMAVRVGWMAGDYATAVERAREIVSWCRGGLGKRRAWAVAVAAMAAGELGQRGLAARFLEMSERTYGDRHWYVASHQCGWARGVVAWQEDRLEDALPVLGAAAEGLLAMGALPLAAFVEADRVQVAAEAGESSEAIAAQAAGRLAALAARLPPPLYDALARLGSSWSRLRALPGQAEAEAEAAAAILGEMGLRPFQARALEVVARGRLARGADARAAVAAAADAYGALGAAWRRERLLRLGGQRLRTAPVAGLTPRERAVADLTVQGLTASQVGERLGIGRRTVESHLGNVYVKLGLSSRVELARRYPATP